MLFLPCSILQLQSKNPPVMLAGHDKGISKRQHLGEMLQDIIKKTGKACLFHQCDGNVTVAQNFLHEKNSVHLQRTCFGHGFYKALLCRTLRGGQAGQIGHTDCTAAQGFHVFCAHLRCVSFQVRRRKDSPCKCREAPQGRGKAGTALAPTVAVGITPAGAGKRDLEVENA